MDRTPAMRQISCGGMQTRAAVVAPARPRGLAGEPLGFIGCHAYVLEAAAEVAHVVLVHHEARGVDDAACTDCWENVLTLEHGACCSDNAVGADLGRVSRAGDVDEVACGLRVLACWGRIGRRARVLRTSSRPIGGATGRPSARAHCTRRRWRHPVRAPIARQFSCRSAPSSRRA